MLSAADLSKTVKNVVVLEGGGREFTGQSGCSTFFQLGQESPAFFS